MYNIAERLITKGKMEGRMEGKMEEKKDIALKLHERSMAYFEISDLIGVSEDVVKKWIEESKE